LIRLIEPWLGPGVTSVLACGMVGSRQGWSEAPYRATPCTPLDAGQMVDVRVRDPRITVQIVPGLKQVKPADVMRGEETQIAGALALDPAFDGAMCLPGTHSKWVQISAGEVVSFQTYLTGEMFSLLSTQSVLRHGMAATGWDEDAFDQGVANGMARPERLAAHLFRLRAEGLIADLGPDAARAQLSGLLIGAELAAARPYWLGARVALVGSAALTALYARALSAMGAPTQTLAAKDCTIAGLARAAGRLMKAAE
jgi:2-dehydro-3-deoxygalactonokinase